MVKSLASDQAVGDDSHTPVPPSFNSTTHVHNTKILRGSERCIKMTFYEISCFQSIALCVFAACSYLSDGLS